MRLIGISGAANSGKDTVAKVLCEFGGFAKVSLADPMKEFCQEVFGFTEEQLWGSSDYRNMPDFRYPRTPEAREWLAENGAPARELYSGFTVIEVMAARIDRSFGVYSADHFLTAREVLQKIAEEWGRTLYPDLWVDVGTWRAGQEMLDPEKPTGVVIPDVRYPNELERIHAMGGEVWRVIRPGQKKLAGKAGQHKSEQALSDTDVFDRLIMNDASLGELEELVIQAAKR